MKLSVLAALAVLAGCGPGPVNRMIGTPERLPMLRPPHEAIYVRTSHGIARVWLDTAEQELVAESAAPAGQNYGGRVRVVDERTSISTKGGHYFIRKSDGLHEVPDVIDVGLPEVSPDRTLFAVIQYPSRVLLTRDEIVVVRIADLAVRRFPLENPTSWVRWSPDGRELYFGVGLRAARLDLATGVVSSVDREIVESARHVEPDRPGDNTCVSRGQRLEIHRASRRQAILLVPLSIPGDPERLSAIEPRLLVEATDHDWSPHSDREFPSRLGDVFFTASCDHFVYTLGDVVYLGETRTGRFARLLSGSDPSRELRRE